MARLDQVEVNQQWQDTRARLVERACWHTVELLDLCRAGALRRFRPSLSLGRLYLQADPAQPLPYTYDFPCLYFHQGQYLVSSYDNGDKWGFATAKEAVAFVREHVTHVPLTPAHTVQLAQATLRGFSLDWETSTMRIDVETQQGPLVLHLTGVSSWEGSLQRLLAPTSQVLEVEYATPTFRLWLHSGDHLRVTATALRVEGVEKR